MIRDVKQFLSEKWSWYNFSMNCFGFELFENCFEILFKKNQYTSEYIKLNKVQYLVTFSLVIRQLEGSRHVAKKEY